MKIVMEYDVIGEYHIPRIRVTEDSNEDKIKVALAAAKRAAGYDPKTWKITWDIASSPEFLDDTSIPARGKVVVPARNINMPMKPGYGSFNRASSDPMGEYRGMPSVMPGRPDMSQ